MGTLSQLGVCTVVLKNDNATVTSVLTGTVATLQGTLCVSVYDTGALSEPVDYVFTGSHP